jgi:hypothetical protein
MSESAALREITSAFGLGGVPRDRDQVEKAQVVAWMSARDIEALGAICTVIMKKQYAERIVPPLTLGEYQGFLMRYFERCFRENPDGEWTSSRYEAGWQLVSWFVGLWKDSSVPRKTFVGMKRWLANMYETGDADLRRCIVDATLEHLFEKRDIARFFADWEKDPVLAQAYREALLWVNGGGKIPLTGTDHLA